MDDIKSLNYLPRALQEQELYLSVTALLDRAIAEGYTPEVSALKSIYDPSSSDYDPYAIIKYLGGNSLSKLLSNFTDETSLALILSDIHNIKGTEAGFIAVLKLLRLNFQSLKYSVQPSGCTDVTVILDPTARLNIDDIRDLEQFTRELFPINLTLVGVTNCLSGVVGPSGLTSLGNHTLDYEFILGTSKMNGAYGSILPEVSETIRFFLCSESDFDLIVDMETTQQFIQSRAKVREFIFDRTLKLRLDRQLMLGNNTYLDYLPFGSTSIGKLVSRTGHIRGIINDYDLGPMSYQTPINGGSSELVNLVGFKPTEGNVFTDDIVARRRVNFCHGANILGWYQLGSDVNPLGGRPPQRLWTNGLGNMTLGETHLNEFEYQLVPSCIITRRVMSSEAQNTYELDGLRLVFRYGDPLFNEQEIDRALVRFNAIDGDSTQNQEAASGVSRQHLDHAILLAPVSDELNTVTSSSELTILLVSKSFDIDEFDDGEYVATEFDMFDTNHVSEAT